MVCWKDWKLELTLILASSNFVSSKQKSNFQIPTWSFFKYKNSIQQVIFTKSYTYQYIPTSSFLLQLQYLPNCSFNFLYHAAFQIKDSILPRTKAQDALHSVQGPFMFWLTLDSSPKLLFLYTLCCSEGVISCTSLPLDRLSGLDDLVRFSVYQIFIVFFKIPNHPLPPQQTNTE